MTDLSTSARASASGCLIASACTGALMCTTVLPSGLCTSNSARSRFDDSVLSSILKLCFTGLPFAGLLRNLQFKAAGNPTTVASESVAQEV